MPDQPGSVSPDAIYTALQSQITTLGSDLGEEIGKLHTAQARIEVSVQEIHTCIKGNGGKGLAERVEDLEERPACSADQTSVDLSVIQHHKWTIFKEITFKVLNLTWKVALVLILLKAGYSELVRPLVGLPPIPSAVTTSVE